MLHLLGVSFMDCTALADFIHKRMRLATTVRGHVSAPNLYARMIFEIAARDGTLDVNTLDRPGATSAGETPPGRAPQPLPLALSEAPEARPAQRLAAGPHF